MTEQNPIHLAALDHIEEILTSLDAQIRLDSKALHLNNGVAYDEVNTDPIILRLEKRSRKLLEQRISQNLEFRKEWAEFSTEIYDEVFGV